MILQNHVVEHPDGTSAVFTLDTSQPDGGWHVASNGLFLHAVDGTTENKYQAVYAVGQWRSFRIAGSRVDRDEQHLQDPS